MVLLLFGVSIGFAQQNISVSGVVTDASIGDPLIGASVQVKGSKLGTVTDVRGQYIIKANIGSTLVVSYLGMIKREVVITNSVMDIELQPDAKSLNEVVAIGYGSAKRTDLTSAQTSVSAKDISKSVNTTLEQALQGRAAGVYITQNSGQPGGGLSINIRGISSINGTSEPLYVIDGVQIQGQSVSNSSSIAGLNPSDIEDMQILQGPSATSVYGSRATNGVVLITTKRGKSGNAQINYTLSYSLQTPPKHLDVMDLQQYAQMVKEYHTVAGGTTPGEFLDPTLLGKGTDWQSELFRNSPMLKNQISMNGGNETTTYYLSGEALNQAGVAIGSGFKRYGMRLNLDTKPRKWVDIGVNLNFNQTKTNLTTSQEGIISNALQLTPQIPVKNLDGTWGGGDNTNGANQYAPVNPVAIAELTTNNQINRQFMGGINLGLHLTNDLTFRTTFNTNVGFGNSIYYRPTYKIGWAINDRASLTDGSSSNMYWNWNQMLIFNKKFAQHSFNIMASHEAQESNWKNVLSSRTGFLTNDIFDLNAGDPTTASNSGGSGIWAMESYLGRISYDFSSKYFLVATIRADGSVNFGSENRWGTFPSISGAWRISQEKFFHVPFISDLKLRLETGITGNQGSGGIYSPMSAGATPNGTGFLPSVYSNPALKWEETKTNNAGFNLGMFNNRIQVEFDYYVKNTSNLLMTNPLPWYMGTNGTGSVGAPTVNIGSLTNKGWALTINTLNLSNRNFRWETNFNISSNKAKIEKFYSDAAFVDRTSWWMNNWTQRSAVGNAPWLFRGYIEEGLFQSVDEINNSAVPVDNSGNRLPTQESNGVWVGDVKYKDISGPAGKPDGKIDSYDQTYIGNPWPKLFGGFTNTFSYKGFDLSILFTYSFGNDVYNYLASVNSNPNNIYLSRNLLLHTMDYAKPITNENEEVVLSNPGTDVARITNLDRNGNYERFTNKWVEDGSYIKLKNISLSYNVPSTLISKQKIVRDIRVTFSAQNILTFTKYKGFDPEVGSYVGANTYAGNQAIGVDFGRYPLTPIYSFNLSVNF
ncbi:MAG: SusC/RagA family TonB-linked outer membrane protein [Paludibacteraceae bacterium]